MTRTRRAGRAWVGAVATLIVLACGGEDPAGSSGSILISLTPTTLPVQQGGSGSLTLSLTRGGGFGGAVALTATGLPAGVTTTFTPAQMTGTTVSSTVGVTVGAAVAPGIYTGTVSATATGIDPATTTYQVSVTAVPEYALTVVPATLTISPGASGEASVNIQRTNFTGAVTFALATPPPGVTGVFDPAQPAGNMSTLTVSIAANVAPGSYPVTVQGTATGPGVRTATLSVTVALPPSYAINLSPAAFAVQRGTSAVVNVMLARSNFTGQVTLALENAPPGITGTLVPASTTGNTSVFTIDVGVGVAPGVYQLSLRGTASGLTDRVAFVQLTVTSTPPGGGNVEYQFCDPSLVPVFFAYQDGVGAWQPVTGFTSGATTTFAFNLTQGRGGVMSVFRTTVANALAVDPAAPVRRLGPRVSAVRGGRSGVVSGPRATPIGAASLLTDVYLTEVLYGTTGELAQDGIDYCALTQPTKTVRGTVAGVPFGQYAIVSLGSSARLFVSGSSSNPLTFAGVPSGRVDLVGSRIATTGAAPDKAIVLRDLDIPDGGSIPASIDFNGPASRRPRR
jgi:hypothetical protein